MLDVMPTFDFGLLDEDVPPITPKDSKDSQGKDNPKRLARCAKCANCCRSVCRASPALDLAKSLARALRRPTLRRP